MKEYLMLDRNEFFYGRKRSHLSAELNFSFKRNKCFCFFANSKKAIIVWYNDEMIENNHSHK